MSPLSALCICLLLGVVSSARITRYPLPHHRIVGGEETDIRSHPHQLTLQISGVHNCGASIISRKWAVTAAHCIDFNTDVSSITLGSGSTHRYNGTLHKVARVVTHPENGLWQADYDITLLEIEDEFTYGETVQPIKLADRELGHGELVNVTGWGILEEAGESTDILRKVTVPIVERSTCSKAYDALYIPISERMICAGLLGEGGKDSCQEDSGGPLTKDGILYGIVSWGQGCGSPEFPGVYANVANMRGWITSVTGV